MGEEVHINPLTGQPLSEENYREIIRTYGSLDNFEKRARKHFGGATPNRSNGDKQFKEAQKGRQQDGVGAMNKIVDGIAEVAHYMPATAAAMDMVDVARSSGKTDTDDVNQVMGAVGSASGDIVKEHTKNLAKGAKDATNGAFVSGFGRMASTGLKAMGFLDDVKQTVSNVKDMIKTPNKDYQSKYFDKYQTEGDFWVDDK